MKKVAFIIIIFCGQIIFGQNGAEIFKQLKKLNTLSTVLYIAAHPDDENTRLISLFSNHYNARTAYLSLTRGDGGQNLIGNELREGLGLIRTQELLEARKIDGGEQFFTTANDFGYSKHPDETLSIWNKDEVLKQIVYRIRAFKPDIIINRFDHRTPGTTHGHHTSSAILSEKAFHLANDPTAYPEQLNNVDLWQPKRQFYNTSWWAYGGRDQFEKADKSKMIEVESNPTDFVLGRTNEEVAAKSRSQHKSQGFGSSPGLGSKKEYLELINGSKPINSNLLDGIDTTWGRISNGNKIQKKVDIIIANFDIEKPYKSINLLTNLYQDISKIDDDFWKEIKLKEVSDLIQKCLGLRFQFNTFQETGIANTSLPTQLLIVNPSPALIKLEKIEGAIDFEISKILSQNQLWESRQNIKIPNKITAPYWLLEEGDLGNYYVKDDTLKGLAETPNPINVCFYIIVNDTPILIHTPLKYKSTDSVDGEIFQNFQILPKATVQLKDKVILFQNNNVKKVSLQVLAHTPNFRGSLSLKIPRNWDVYPKKHSIWIERKGASQEFVFNVTPPLGSDIGVFKALINDGTQEYSMTLEEIKYPHISKQHMLSQNKSIVSKIDLKSNVSEVAYLNGAGDKVAESLRNIGIAVTEFEVDELSLENLLPFPTLIVGIRAFNIHKKMAFKNQILWDYVKLGGTLIIQYNTSRGFDSSIISPYSLKLSRDRVTDETAKIQFLNKNHPLLNEPNRITHDDFKGWVQERGLYFANDWDSRYEPLLSMNDKGENPKKGSLLVADYGKGRIIYTGLSFFRELPAGVPGAYRLFANLISYGQQ